MDEQTLRGKAPAGVAAAARAAGIPVVAVAGRCLLEPAALREAGIQRAYALSDLEPDHCSKHGRRRAAARAGCPSNCRRLAAHAVACVSTREQGVTVTKQDFTAHPDLASRLAWRQRRRRQRRALRRA